MSEATEKILRYYKGSEGYEAAVQLVDLAEQVRRSGKFKVSGFLDPYGQEIAETVIANYPGLKLDFDGGYRGAERQRAMYADSDFKGNPSYGVAAIKITWNGQVARPSHRDILGSLIGLGIDRSRIGDIIISGDSAMILTDDNMVGFLLTDFAKVGSISISCEEADVADIPPKEERCKEISATVASLRVDAIAAAGYGVSRSKAAADIDADKMKLNWKSVKNSDRKSVV